MSDLSSPYAKIEEETTEQARDSEVSKLIKDDAGSVKSPTGSVSDTASEKKVEKKKDERSRSSRIFGRFWCWRAQEDASR